MIADEQVRAKILDRDARYLCNMSRLAVADATVDAPILKGLAGNAKLLGGARVRAIPRLESGQGIKCGRLHTLIHGDNLVVPLARRKRILQGRLACVADYAQAAILCRCNFKKV